MTAQRILVIGRSGQLAQALAAAGRSGLVCRGRPKADLADAAGLAALIAREAPDVVINAGAYTAVDGAESDPASAEALNATGPAALALACAAHGIPIVHVSTDCVFDGMKDTPYTEDDAVAPLGVYGQTKANGEGAVARAATKHVIVRVSWVFSQYAGNFVRTMLSLARNRETVAVVNDQFGYPTFCPEIARGLLAMADRAIDPAFRDWGTYHLAGNDETDRASMARRIFEVSARQGGPTARVEPVATADYPTPARRPLNARLDSAKAARVFGIRIDDWEAGLETSVTAILGAEART